MSKEAILLFIVSEIKKIKIEKKSENKINIVITLMSKNPKEDPRFGSSLSGVF